MKRPLSLWIAVLMQWVAAAVAIYSGVALIISAWSLNTAEVRDAVNQAIADAGVTSITATTITMGVIAGGLLTGAIGVFRIIIAVSLGRGRAWARLVLSVLSILVLVSGVGYLLRGTEGLLQGLATLGVEILILWLMWNARARAYFRAQRTVTEPAD